MSLLMTIAFYFLIGQLLGELVNSTTKPIRGNMIFLEWVIWLLVWPVVMLIGFMIIIGRILR